MTSTDKATPDLIPGPFRENDLLEHAVNAAAAGGGAAARKRAVRREQRRWHPDKLLPLLEQRGGAGGGAGSLALAEGERRRIIARLSGICEYLAGEGARS